MSTPHITGTIGVNLPACLTCYAETGLISPCREARRDAARALYAALLEDAAQWPNTALDDIVHDLITTQEPGDGLQSLEGAPYYGSPVKEAAVHALRMLDPHTFPAPRPVDGAELTPTDPAHNKDADA